MDWNSASPRRPVAGYFRLADGLAEKNAESIPQLDVAEMSLESVNGS